MISVMILTKNEERDLPEALASVAWSDDVHVFDSESTDRTQEIALAHGARVTVRRFDNYAAQRNAAMQLPFRHPWVLILDADERPGVGLAEELQEVIRDCPKKVAGFSLRRRDYLWGRWLKHAQITPYYVRLVRPDRVHYTREINEVITIEGGVRKLRGHLDHLAFSKGFVHWVDKHNIYSSMEAQLLASGQATRPASLHAALFGKSLSERRVAQKAIFYKLPLRPFVKWIYMMFVRGAILDGRAGLVYSTLHSYYEYLIELKRVEIHRREAGKAP